MCWQSDPQQGGASAVAAVGDAADPQDVKVSRYLYENSRFPDGQRRRCGAILPGGAAKIVNGV